MTFEYPDFACVKTKTSGRMASRAPLGLLRRVPALAVARSMTFSAAKRPVHDAVPSRGMASIKGAKLSSTDEKVSHPLWRRRRNPLDC